MSVFLQPILSKINKNSHPATLSLKQCQNSINNQYDKTWENKTIKSEKSITGNKIFRMKWGGTLKFFFSPRGQEEHRLCLWKSLQALLHTKLQILDSPAHGAFPKVYLPNHRFCTLKTPVWFSLSSECRDLISCFAEFSTLSWVEVTRCSFWCLMDVRQEDFGIKVLRCGSLYDWKSYAKNKLWPQFLTPASQPRVVDVVHFPFDLEEL